MLEGPVEQKIIKDLADKYNFSIKDISEMVGYQYKFLARTISSAEKKEGKFPSLRMIHMGMFTVLHGNRKLLKERYNEEDCNAGGSEE